MVLDLAKLLDAKAQLIAQSAKEELAKKQQLAKDEQIAALALADKELELRESQQERTPARSLDELIDTQQSPPVEQKKEQSFVSYESAKQHYSVAIVTSENPRQQSAPTTQYGQQSHDPFAVVRDVKHLHTSKTSSDAYKS
jgi:hypothetical protein